MSRAKIYVIHHDAENYPAFSSEVVTPILAGNATRDGHRIALKDTDTSDGKICILDTEKQDLYSEFTALHYVWKNYASKYNDGDIVGFMHYRSYLNLRENLKNTYPSIDSCFGYDESSLCAYMSHGIPSVDEKGQACSETNGISAIVSKPLDFRDGIYNQFNSCHPMASTLFKKAKELLAKKSQYKYITDYFDEHFSMGSYANKIRNRKGFFKCLFISTWKYFKDYCEFLFYVLDNLYNDKTVMSEMKSYPMIKGPDNPKTQKHTRYRLLAFFGERLTSLFIAASIKSGRFKIGTAPISHFTKMSEFVRNVYPTYPDKNLIPMVRVYSIAVQDHKAITDLSELDTMNKDGYFFEGPLGYVYDKQVSGSTPIYRYSSGTDHFCKKEPNTGDAHCDGILGYTRDRSNVETNETIHLIEYRLCGYGVGDYLPSIDPEEIKRLKSPFEGAYIPFTIDLGYTVDMWKK